MKLCFSTLGCPDWTLEQVAQMAPAIGFDGVELRIGENKHVNTSFDSSKRKMIRKLFTDYGLDIVCLSGYTHFSGSNASALEESGEILLSNAALAADLNAPYVRSFLGDGGLFTDRGEEVLRVYSERAAELGVTVLLEIHDALKTGRQAAAILSAINSKGLGILWDIHHSVMGGEAPEETWNQLGGNIRHVHMKDASANMTPCHIGEGVLPVAGVTRMLEEKGYTGYLSYEWEKMWMPELDGPEKAFPQYVAFMKTVIGG